MSQSVLNTLKKAAAGLTLPSESDEPIEPIAWGQAASLSPADALRLSGHKPGDTIETTDLDDIFRDALAGDDAAKFRSLIKTLKGALSDLRVYRVGDIEKDVYIVGRTPDGTWAGLKSKVVES